MAEVGVHFEYVFVAVLQSPFETGNVCCAKAEFASALHQVQFVFELVGHQALYNVCGAIGRPVVNDQNMKAMFGQTDYGAYDILNVFFFVVGRNYYNAVALFH